MGSCACAIKKHASKEEATIENGASSENKVPSQVPEEQEHQMLNEYDVLISMAEEPYIPDFLKDDKKVINWSVKNPSFVTKEVMKMNSLIS